MHVRYPGLLAIVILVTAAGLQAQSRDVDVRAATERILPKLIEVRHDLHRNPELGNRETRTAALVARELRRLGLEVRTGIAKTGVVGILRGGRPGRVVGVRADMDALPVTEKTDLPFKSVETVTYLGRQTGVSHACGHDIHVSVVLGVAEVLSASRGRLPGSVVFYFQPAEEGPPLGEEGGAKLMIAEGVLRNPKPDYIFAFHANGDPPDEVGDWERVGKISYTPGPQYAASTAWRARVIGRQAHGASPHLGVDAIVTASQIVTGLQAIRSRTLSPLEPAVVTVGVFQAGDRRNIIAGEAHLEGTVRTFSDSTTNLIKARMQEIFAGEAAAAGARFELTFEETVPVTVNDTMLARRAHAVLARTVGAENVGIVPPETGAEDFSYFAREIPSFYFKVGAVRPGNTSGGHHTPTFRADDEAIPVGVRALTGVVLEALAPGS
ncbi:MAG TPA: amidohydrolase [Gemmatimonadales bacterium]|nr:amidohydrolase [Gemmatimonadales bacterium]